jgi:hypothetical protein
MIFSKTMLEKSNMRGSLSKLWDFFFKSNIQIYGFGKIRVYEILGFWILCLENDGSENI